MKRKSLSQQLMRNLLAAPGLGYKADVCFEGTQAKAIAGTIQNSQKAIRVELVSGRDNGYHTPMSVAIELVTGERFYANVPPSMH